MGLGEGARGLLLRLGRAAGLSALATATMASGPCGTCSPARDETWTIAQLVSEREKGLAMRPVTDVDAVAIAETWNGVDCPDWEQLAAIFKLSGAHLVYAFDTVRLADGECHYHSDEECDGGRPFLVAGRAQVAALHGLEAPRELDDTQRSLLSDALMEHASVAAFARLSLQLLSLGAPADLTRDAQLASLDELRHADFFFERASAAAGAGVRLRPGPLPMHGALDDLSMAGLIESNLREGCIGETLAAEQMRRRAEHAQDPQLKAALLEICEDETRHAELAFRILAWCLAEAPDLTRRIVARVLAEPRPRRGGGDNATWQGVLEPLLRGV
jgi:hypothetical protein